MKKFFSWTLALGLLTTAALPGAAQTVLVGTGTPNASAALDVQSTNQGMLVPRLTASQRTGISSAATGLLVYQTDAPAGFYFYDGSAWASLNGGGGGTTLPSQTGNAGKVLTTDGTNLSFTNYYKETLAVVRLPASGNLNYVIPPFTNGVNTHIVFFTGVWGSSAPLVTLTFPEPSTVPDGTRIIVKRMSANDGINPTSLTIPWTGWPATSGIDGNFFISGNGSFLLNDSNGSTGSSNGASSTGSTQRYAITFMKITHFPLSSNQPTQTTLYSEWVPLVGWKE